MNQNLGSNVRLAKSASHTHCNGNRGPSIPFDHDHHESVRRWWADSQSRGEPFTVPDIVWVGFVRIATNRRIMPVPASLEQTWDFMQKVPEQPTYLAFSADSRTLSRFADIVHDAGATADLVTDAYIAATASTFGGTVVTLDRDFRRFDGVKVNELRQSA